MKIGFTLFGFALSGLHGCMALSGQTHGLASGAELAGAALVYGLEGLLFGAIVDCCRWARRNAQRRHRLNDIIERRHADSPWAN